MDSDPRLVVFFIILSTNPKMLQMMNILVIGSDEKTLRGPDRVMTNPKSIKETRVARREEERPAQAERRSTITTDWSPIAR